MNVYLSYLEMVLQFLVVFIIMPALVFAISIFIFWANNQLLTHTFGEDIALPHELVIIISTSLSVLLVFFTCVNLADVED